MRVPTHVHAVIEEAAALVGTTVGQFMLQAALNKAYEVIDRERVIRLSKRDSERLLELLDNPPPPNAKLQRALDAHRKLTGGNLRQAFEWPPRDRCPAGQGRA